MLRSLLPAAGTFRSRRWLLALVGGFLCACLAMAGVAGPILGFNGLAWLGHFELGIFESRLLTVPIRADPELLLISIEQQTPGRLGLDPALQRLPRRWHALLVDRLREAGARAVVLDLVFEQAMREADDGPLRAALARSAPLAVVLATDGDADEPTPDPDAPGGWRYPFVLPVVLPSPAPPNVTLASAVGWDPGRVLSGAVLLQAHATARLLVPHLAAAAAAARFGIRPAELRWDRARDRLEAGPLSWPVGADCEVLTRFTGPDSSIERIEYAEALALLAQADARERFRGRVVLVGDFTGNDAHVTRRGRMHGTEFVAQTVNTLLQPTGLHPGVWGVPLNFGWSWLLAAAGSLALTSMTWRVAVTGIAAAFLASALAPLFAIRVANLWMLTVAPTVAVAVSLLISGFVIAGVAGGLVPRYVQAGRPRSLTGEATVMFVDLRGSTPLTGRLGPAGAAQEYRRLLETLGRVVRTHGGEVERTLGDGLLALFRPSRGQSHPLRCLAAANGVLADARRISEDWADRHGLPASVTIGIETGIVTGTVLETGGAPEWSSFGLTVNIAARLQRACDDLGVDVLIGPAAAALTQHAVDLLPLDPISLRGIDAPLSVSTFVGPGRTGVPANQ